MIIMIVIYLLSILAMRWVYRLYSSRYWGLWCDEDCVVSILWFIPFLNTWVSIQWYIQGVTDPDRIDLHKKRKVLPKSKWLNTDNL